ncbi:hypothetical protein [Blastomonas sp. AAP53]|uniref:hypothetical protein n=1 Tax=Blastomonas sp. AAP53 TaxID=1248760 RepID=UPI0002EA6436|nr:hypothetical protein [Blastomonas sp. AAP53]
MTVLRKILTGLLFIELASSPAAADAPEASAQAHNAAYQAAASSGLSPQTLSEMLTCSAMWDRWTQTVSNAGDPRFTGSLLRELSAANASRRKTYWQRRARREMGEDDDAAYFDRMQAKAASDADRHYAAYVKSEERAMARVMEWLGICK